MDLRLVTGIVASALLAPTHVHAHGAFPEGATVEVGRGEYKDLVVFGTTIGLLISNDGGGSFYWVCETALDLQGVVDPVYQVAPDGTIYAGTPVDGLRRGTAGGCNWQTIAGALDSHGVSDLTFAPDGSLWVATTTSDLANDVFVSSDGLSFTPTNLSHPNAWWRSIRIAADALNPTVYVAGLIPGQATDAGTTPPSVLLYRSDNSGQSWTNLDTNDFVFGGIPQLKILAVSPTNHQKVFARVILSGSPIGDSVYRSDDAGETWIKLIDIPDTITAFQLRADGSLIIGTRISGMWLSTNDGQDWTRPYENHPQMLCIAENEDGLLFGCGGNWEPDFYLLGTSTDALEWTRILRFATMAGPLACAGGTIQHDTCEVEQWPLIDENFGVGDPDAGPPSDAGTGLDGGIVINPPKGCNGCNLTFLVILLWPSGGRGWWRYLGRALRRC